MKGQICLDTLFVLNLPKISFMTAPSNLFMTASLMSVLKFKTSSITSARLGDWGLIQIFVREGLESMILKQIDVKPIKFFVSHTLISLS